jgi:hypothetical protein
MHMSIKAVVTTLILGSSAVASAKPISQQAWEHQHQQDLRERERLAHERDGYAQRERVERERLARERVELDRYRDRDRFDRERLARERMERDRLVTRERWERERLTRIERERRLERERFERMWWMRDHRYHSRYQVDPGYYGRTWYRPGYVSLIAPTALVEGRMFVSVAPELGELSTLRLDGTGLTYVQKVIVEFDNGTVEEIGVGQWVDSNNPIELAVPRSGIARRIVVYGQSQYGGQIAVTAAA